MTEQHPAPSQEPPVASFQDTPEFQAAVRAAAEQAAQDAVRRTLTELQGGAPAVSGALDPATKALVDGLAMSIASLNGQHKGGQKIIPPETLEKWAAARERMRKLLHDLHRNGEVPTYTLARKVYLNEVLIEPMFMNAASRQMEKTVIAWPDEPNDAMVPENEAAHAVFALFRESTGAVERKRQRAEVAPWFEGRKGYINVVQRGKPGSFPPAMANPELLPDPRDLARRPPGGQTVESKRIFGTVAEPVRIQA